MAENLTIVEQYTLPSLGKIYEQEINPEVKLRSMTTNEEMLRLSPSERSYQVLADIIDDCLLTKLPISSYDLCIGDFIYLLHKLRVTTYGPDYKTISTCPYCGTTNEKIINLDELKWKTYSEDLNSIFEFDIPVSKNRIKIKAQTPRMIDNVTVKSKDLKTKVGVKAGDPALLFNIIECLDLIDGVKPNPIYVEKFIRELPMGDTNTITKHIERINERIGLDSNVETNCNLCGLAYTNSFRITQEFFGPSIDID